MSTCTGNCNQGRDCTCTTTKANSCENCHNKPYRNGAGGPCASCVENSNWHNGEVRGASRPAGEASASTVVLEGKETT